MRDRSGLALSVLEWGRLKYVGFFPQKSGDEVMVMSRDDPEFWSSLSPEAVAARQTLLPPKTDMDEFTNNVQQSLRDFTRDVTFAMFGIKPPIKKLLPGRA